MCLKIPNSDSPFVDSHVVRLVDTSVDFRDISSTGLLYCVVGVLCAVVAWCPGAVMGQGVFTKVLASDAQSVTYETTMDWAMSLPASIDSSGASTLAPSAVFAAVRADLEHSTQVSLPSLVVPRLEIVASDFDEYVLPAGDADSALVSDLSQPPASLSGLGTHRKQPVVSLVIRAITYTEDTATIRRYKRLVTRIIYRGSDRANSAGRPFSQALTAASAAVSLNGHLRVDRSVLADGIVLKIPVTREGIYRIDRAFLSDAGLDPDTIDPDRLQVLGNGGAPLPALNSADRPVDLVQNPAYVTGGGDGSFGENDVLLFYGKAPSGWTYDAENGQWAHYVNPFSVQNYYFLKVADTDGLRLDSNPSFAALPGAERFSSVTGRLFVDFDRFNWSKQNGSGLTWVSNPIDATGRLDVVADSLPPGFQGGLVTYQVQVAIRSNPVASAVFSSSNAQLASIRTGIVQFDDTSASARLGQVGFTDELGSGQPMNLSMTVQQGPNNPEAALDWVRATYDQQLTTSNGVLRFSTPAETSGALEFVLRGFATEPQVWDVTSPGGIRRLGVRAAGSDYHVQIEVQEGTPPRELMAFTDGSAMRLDGTAAHRVAPQNLHGIQEFPDFVIVTPAPFAPYAEELAEIRRQEGLRVTVTEIEKIYNEFSGGLVDMRAVRDYLRFLYDRAPSDPMRIKYALFYGDGHFNYRELGAEPVELQNWIPPYETVDSFTPDQTFTSDDYFGLLDPEEGAWIYRGFQQPVPTSPLTEPVDRVDIGIGRFTVQTEEEARTVLEKLKHYENPETFGSWRTRYTFIADDDLTGLSGTTDEQDLHLQNADVVAELIKDQYGEMNIKKIYASSFQREFRNGFKIPGAREEILNALEEGSLLVNYSGHGGEEGLAQEGIFSAEDARTLTNFDRLAIFVTATCSFGWWDLASYQSGAEELLLNPDGGAVALLTTVRLVYTSPGLNTLNVGLNRQLARDMFESEENGQMRRLGDILRLTKNTRVGLQGNNRKFNLLGDPTMRVGLPSTRHRIEVDALNEVDLAVEQGQLRALDRVTLRGRIMAGEALDNAFNGSVEVTLFDAERRIPIEEQRHMPTPYYTVREDLIWRGQVQANQGRFEATFVAPKDISYSNLPGRVSLYAYQNDRQAIGYNENFIVGGTSGNPPDDALGPQISLFLNDTTFVTGGLTSSEPRLIVKLFDQSGINTVGAGVGHEMLLTVNDDAQNAVDIGGAFRSEANSFQRGIVEWELSDIPVGANTLSLRAWDVLNNSATETLDFFVSEDEDLVLRNVYNYPNPTTGETRFIFEHNQPVGTSATVQVRIYTLAGRLIRTIETDEVLPGGALQLPWDGRDEDTDPLSTGIYLYKLRVEVDDSEGGRQVSERIEKLAVIR